MFCYCSFHYNDLLNCLLQDWFITLSFAETICYSAFHWNHLLLYLSLKAFVSLPLLRRFVTLPFTLRFLLKLFVTRPLTGTICYSAFNWNDILLCVSHICYSPFTKLVSSSAFHWNDLLLCLLLKYFSLCLSLTRLVTLPFTKTICYTYFVTLPFIKTIVTLSVTERLFTLSLKRFATLPCTKTICYFDLPLQNRLFCLPLMDRFITMSVT